MKKALLLICFLLIMPSISYGITIGDNTLSDWGVNPAQGWWVPGVSTANYGTTTVPLQGVTQGGISYWIEDTQNNNYVGPGYGTECDIKAMYATNDSTNLYFAIALGDSVKAASVFDLWGAGNIGDIGFSLNSGATYAYGIATKKRPEETIINTAHNLTPGNLYLVSNWTQPSPYSASGDARINTYYGTTLGAISYSFGEYPGLGFYLIEGAIPLDLLNGDVINMIHLTQTCGNDVGNLKVASVPEPSTLLFLGMGLLSLAGMGRRWIKIKVK